MNVETIRALAEIYEELPYFWQVILFCGGMSVILLVAVVIISITTILRILAEGIASFLSFGRVTFDETSEETKWKLPSLGLLLPKKEKVTK